MRHLPRMRIRGTIACCCLLSSAILLATGFSLQQPALAETKNAPTGSLTGSVSSATLQAHAQLKEIDSSSKMLQRSAMDMIGEVERTDWVIAAEPEAIGPIIVPAVTYPTQGLGDLDPPRKKWVDFLMNQMAQLIDMTNGDINATQMSKDASTEITSSWKEVKDLMLDVTARYQNLKTLTQGPKYDNLKIGKQALAIYDDMTRLEGLNKKLTCLVRAN